MAEIKTKETPKVSVSGILSKEGDDMEKAASKKPSSKKDDKKSGTKKKHKHTHIEHHDNGTHTVRHTPEGGGPETSYAAKDLDEVHDGLEEHVGDPNGDEGQEPPTQQPQPSGSQATAQPQPQPMPQGA
jgi:hypothetical protein